MKIFKLKIFLFLVLFGSCNQVQNCIYTEEEHKAKLNSKIKHSIYPGEGKESKNWTVYDETDSFGRGNSYIFNKGRLEVFTFHYSKDTPCYMERASENGFFKRITSQPLLDFYFRQNSKNQIHLYLVFTTIKTKINEVKIMDEKGENSNLHIYKDSAKTNEYYCKIYLSNQDSNSIYKARYFLEYKSEDCKGQILTYLDTARVF
jgi:hypothetical protein